MRHLAHHAVYNISITGVIVLMIDIIKSRTSSKFGEIGLRTAELHVAVLERLGKSP